METFAGQVVMVTGGATGLGAEIVRRFAELGAGVACCYYKSRAGAEALAAELREHGSEIFPVQVDVGDGAQVQAAVAAIAAHFGHPVSILVNNAGDNINPAPIDEMSEETWDRVLDVNLKGAFLCAKYCIPAMKAARSGRVINITSISARSGGGPGGAAYAASKGGLEAFNRALAKELAPFGVTANGVAPGVVYTPLHERTNTPESLERLRQNIPLLRLGAPVDVAALVTFLASPEAGYITGENIAVNGGFRMD
jgi:3-oxoacyl-[acyl-carrier protein] reductase